MLRRCQSDRQTPKPKHQTPKNLPIPNSKAKRRSIRANAAGTSVLGFLQFPRPGNGRVSRKGLGRPRPRVLLAFYGDEPSPPQPGRFLERALCPEAPAQNSIARPG